MLPPELRPQSPDDEERLKAINRTEVIYLIKTPDKGAAFFIAVAPTNVSTYDWGYNIRVSKISQILKFFETIGFPSRRKNDLGWNYYNRERYVLFFVYTDAVEKGIVLEV